MNDGMSQEETKDQKRRRLEDYLDARKLYDELNEIATEKEKKRHFNCLMREIAC